MRSSPVSRSARLVGSSLFLSIVLAGAAVKGAPSTEAFLGEWDGTSSCVDKVKFPSCHDEVVIYHVARSSAGDSYVTLSADKVVGGKAAAMGDLDFRFDPSLKAWTSQIKTSGGNELWSFQVTGSELSGTLVELPSNTLIRKVTAKKRQ